MYVWIEIEFFLKIYLAAIKGAELIIKPGSLHQGNTEKLFMGFIYMPQRNDNYYSWL